MTQHELDLPSDAYVPVTSDDVQVGDICQAVVLPDPADPGFYAADDLPGRVALAARVVYAVVISVYEGYVVVAPVTTSDVVSDAEQFSAIAAAGHKARESMTLPALEGEWEQEAVAMLFMPQTLPEEAVAGKRVAAMAPGAREAVGRRITRAFSPDDD